MHLFLDGVVDVQQHAFTVLTVLGQGADEVDFSLVGEVLPLLLSLLQLVVPGLLPSDHLLFQLLQSADRWMSGNGRYWTLEETVLRRYLGSRTLRTSEQLLFSSHIEIHSGMFAHIPFQDVLLVRRGILDTDCWFGELAHRREEITPREFHNPWFYFHGSYHCFWVMWISEGRGRWTVPWSEDFLHVYTTLPQHPLSHSWSSLTQRTTTSYETTNVQGIDSPELVERPASTETNVETIVTLWRCCSVPVLWDGAPPAGRSLFQTGHLGLAGGTQRGDVLLQLRLALLLCVVVGLQLGQPHFVLLRREQNKVP